MFGFLFYIKNKEGAILKYKDWLNEWLENYVKQASKVKTYTRYAQIANSHLIPRLGDYEMEEISPQLLQQQIVDLRKCGNCVTGEGLAPTTVNLIVAVIQESLATAYELELCQQYTADKIKRPRVEEKKVECFSVPEQKQIEEAVRNDKRPKTVGILLCLYTGLRIGELLALEWADIDFEKREISVSKTCHDSTDQKGKYCRFVHGNGNHRLRHGPNRSQIGTGITLLKVISRQFPDQMSALPQLHRKTYNLAQKAPQSTFF